jgi:RNA polymerase sigma-70 factor (ECF subfamily)
MGTVICNLDELSPIPALPGERHEVSLIRQILTGRRDLFGDLIEPHLDSIWRAVRAKMGNDPDVDDVFQQVVFKAFLHLEQFRFEASFRTWMIRIARNEATENWRRRFAARSVALDPSAIAQIHVADSKDSPFEVCMRSQTAGLLQVALAHLTEKDRQVIRMRDLEERTISEVAEALRLRVSAVKTRHHRARRRMAKILAKLDAARSLAR